MNRIILIGNGFDLAHRMKTSYNDFIHNYWKNIITQLKREVAANATSYPSTFESEEIIVDRLYGQWGNKTIIEATNFRELEVNLKSQSINLIFKNKLLEILTGKHRELNWVDIEIEYYNLLKDSFKNERCTYRIGELNKDFKRIQILLENYLREIEDKFAKQIINNGSILKLMNNIGTKIYSPFKLKDFNEISINKTAEIKFQSIQPYLKSSSNSIAISDLIEKDQKLIYKLGSDATTSDIRKLLLSDDASNYFDLIPEEILFLNFNYTFTEKLYWDYFKFNPSIPEKDIKLRTIHIHGTTDKYDRNDIIFGFGDEIDEDYKSIENLNENIYLENIKSIKYLETDNYKQLLEFLNADNYQIFIFGHSCGISDRTLLNTLFEHKNCSSIKPFYYQTENGTDNYSDIVRNISRNFSSKASMRDKVVNKEYCESLS